MSHNNVNYGNQVQVFSFHQEARSKGFNQGFCDILPCGVYIGGLLTRLNDNLIQIGELTVLIRSNESDKVALRTETTEIQELIVSRTKPYVVLRFGWANSDNNFMDMRAVGWSADPLEADEDKLWPLDIILGKVQFSESPAGSGVYIVDPDNPFDLSRRKDVFLKEAENVYAQLRVSVSEINPKRVYISGGGVNTSKGRFVVPGGEYPSIDIPDTEALARTDLIAVDALGQIKLIQGTPSVSNPAPAPRFETYKVCALIRRGPGRTDIKGSDIVQMADSSRRGQWLAEDFPLADAGNKLPANAKNIEAAFDYLFHRSYIMTPDDPSVLAKVLRKHINFGTSEPDGVYAGSLPVRDTDGLFTGTDVETVLAEIAGSGRTAENLKGLADAIDALIYGRYSQTIQNVSTDRPVFFCKVKPNTSAVINLKVSGPAFQGSINLAVTVGEKTELNKAAMSVLAASIPAFFSGSAVYLATGVDGLLEDFIFIGFSVPATGVFTIGMQAVSSERNGIAAAALSVPMANVPNVQFKVSDGYLAGYPVIKPVRELDAFRQWSAAYQYAGEDPVFFHGSVYFANPAMVPEAGESPASAPAKWIQLARPDPGPMDITEGAKTPQLFYRPGLIISNTTALKLRKAHQDQGMRYPSKESKVYHFDDDLLDQDQQNPLNISCQVPEPWYNEWDASQFHYNDIAGSVFAYNFPDFDNIIPRFVNEDSAPEPPLAATPAMTKKPFKEVPSFYFGTYKITIPVPDNTGENVLDYWFKTLSGGGFGLIDIVLPTGELIDILLGYEEPFFNDNTGIGVPDNFPYNSNVLMPGTVMYNERDTDSDMAIVQGFQGHRVRKDFEILDAPQPGVWNHISLRIGMNSVSVFLNGKQESFDRLSSGFGGESVVTINPEMVPIGIDEMLMDFHHVIDFNRFIQVSGRMLPWAFHEWDDGWLTIYGDDPAKIDSNLALYIFPVGSVITQASAGGVFNDSQTPWERFHNFIPEQFVLQGEIAPLGGNGEKTRIWQRVQ